MKRRSMQVKIPNMGDDVLFRGLDEKIVLPYTAFTVVYNTDDVFSSKVLLINEGLYEGEILVDLFVFTRNGPYIVTKRPYGIGERGCWFWPMDVHDYFETYE